jgi:hypothetical protein
MHGVTEFAKLITRWLSNNFVVQRWRRNEALVNDTCIDVCYIGKYDRKKEYLCTYIPMYVSFTSFDSQTTWLNFFSKLAPETAAILIEGRLRVARFILVQPTKTSKNIPKNTKYTN